MNMNNFDKFKQMSLKDFVEWLDEYGNFDGSPWMKWFDEKYCQNCDHIITYSVDFPNIEMPCSYCELYGNCKFFPDKEDTPDNKEIIEMWLAEEGE